VCTSPGIAPARAVAIRVEMASVDFILVGEEIVLGDTVLEKKQGASTRDIENEWKGSTEESNERRKVK
jgi:hypothetical protein